MDEITFNDYLRIAEAYARHIRTKQFAERFRELPRDREGQEELLGIRYRSPIDGEVYLNKRSVKDCSGKQVYAAARRVLEESWKKAGREPEMEIPDDLAAIVKSCIKVSTDTLRSWVEEAERESSLSDDEHTFSPEQIGIMEYELTRRDILSHQYT